MMDEQLKKFIEENINLIEKNTKESWGEIYKNIYYEYTGEFTQIMLEAGIDPADVLGYIPVNYLNRCNIQNYEIPHIVTDIGDYAFCYCSNLTDIEIPNSIIKIGYCSFAYCRSLENVVIENNRINIDDYAFQYCDDLKEIIFKGTKEEAIKCGLMKKKWRRGSPIKRIICTDGVIDL